MSHQLLSQAATLSEMLLSSEDADADVDTIDSGSGTNADTAVAVTQQSPRDVIIHAHTGSGKTLAFLLPLFQSIDQQSEAIQVSSEECAVHWWLNER